jgi:hypothetical protein
MDSFITPPLVTFYAIVVGYVTYSLDTELTNEFDSYIVRSIWQLLRIGDGNNITLHARKIRNEALTRSVLSLSNQELVTGLGILITGYY